MEPIGQKLERRTEAFAAAVRVFVNALPKGLITEDAKQLWRSSGSVGANYIEANESLSKKDFVFRLKIVRKEAKESAYWLRLLAGSAPETERAVLMNEANEIRYLLSAIIKNIDEKAGV